MKIKVFYKSSIFPADIDCVFSLLKNLETLQYMAKPYASFTPIDENSNIRWEEGQTISFKFKLFCFVPYGTHTIHVINFSKHSIYTNESNTHVPVWNHRIRLDALSDGTTRYSDEVEIGAGWKTIFVWLWAKCFYAHRQKRWLNFLSNHRGIAKPGEPVNGQDERRFQRRRLVERGISVNDIIRCIDTGEIIKQYEDDKPFPSCLILGAAIDGEYIHVVVSHDSEWIYLITAYHPDADVWESDFKTRKEH